MKKIKISMIGHKRIPSREGGVEIVVEELSTRLVKMGYEVTCYNRNGHHVSGSNFDSENINIYKGVKLKRVLTIDKKGLAAMTSSFFGALKIAFSDCNVVHFHAEGPCAMIWIPKLFGKRCIATIHGLDWQREKWKGGFASKYIKFGEKMAVKYADEIIVLSKNVQNYFKEYYDRQTNYIPNGVNKPVVKGAKIITDKFGLKKDEYFLFLGRLVPEKGLKYLVEAFKNVETNKKLVIAGGSSDTDDFFREIKEMSRDDSRIIYTGFVQGEILDELYSNAYTYILPSDLEGMPLSLLEAMSYGNCCLTSDIDECVEVVGEYAMTFKKSDVSDLTSVLQMLSDNVDIVNHYKKNASHYICNKYNWDDVSLKTLELYRGEHCE